MYQVGIDIGSSAAKVAVINNGEVVKTILMDTGFSSRKVADEIYAQLEAEGITKDNAKAKLDDMVKNMLAQIN